MWRSVRSGIPRSKRASHDHRSGKAGHAAHQSRDGNPCLSIACFDSVRRGCQTVQEDCFGSSGARNAIFRLSFLSHLTANGYIVGRSVWL